MNECCDLDEAKLTGRCAQVFLFPRSFYKWEEPCIQVLFFPVPGLPVGLHIFRADNLSLLHVFFQVLDKTVEKLSCLKF